MNTHMQTNIHTGRILCKVGGTERNSYGPTDAKNGQQPPDTSLEAQSRLSLTASKGTNPVHILISDFQTPDLRERIHFCCMSHLVCGTLTWQSWELRWMESLKCKTHGTSWLGRCEEHNSNCHMLETKVDPESWSCSLMERSHRPL